MVQLVNHLRKVRSKVDDLLFYPIHFRSTPSSSPLIWASLRMQILYRAVSGIVNYSKPIKLLFRVEKREVVHVLYYDRCVEGTQGFVSQTRILVRTPLDVVDIRVLPL